MLILGLKTHGQNPKFHSKLFFEYIQTFP